MSHSNGRIYIDTSVTPNIGISLDDIGSVLGVSTRDLGTLCTHPQVKKWAKYKPLPVGIPGSYTQAQAKGCNYGLYIPYFTTYADMVAAVRDNDYSDAPNYDATKAPFDRILPSQWYRALDFNGYNDNALPPIALSVYAQNPVPFRFIPTFTLTSQVKQDCIAISNINFTVEGTTYENMYYGIQVLHSFASKSHDEAVEDSGYLDSEGSVRTLGGGIEWNRDQASSVPTYGKVFAFLTNLRTFTATQQGIFVPLTFTLQEFLLSFATLSIYPHFDTVMPYSPSKGCIYWLLENYNDYNILGKNCSATIATQSTVWADTDNFTLPYPLPYNTTSGTAEGIVIKITPNASTRKALVQYVTRSTWPVSDNVMLDDDGNPIEFEVDIIDGTILSGTPFPNEQLYLTMLGTAYLADDPTQTADLTTYNEPF